MATEGTVCDLKKNKMCLINVDETVFYDPVEKKKTSVDMLPIGSIDTQLSASVQISEQSGTEKSKFGGRTRKMKKKRNGMKMQNFVTSPFAIAETQRGNFCKDFCQQHQQDEEERH
ncbi:hypothetical protein DY000_02049725 [Brassica cretica]|uniref:Uncharacterized protein n=1 Tax=Brassica cretica TaxID=69181 RepID=A0ABQ7F7E7_BRACR|nr:hypothetical protein DY000_02049725 [Brassica cretica]